MRVRNSGTSVLYTTTAFISGVCSLRTLREVLLYELTPLLLRTSRLKKPWPPTALEPHLFCNTWIVVHQVREWNNFCSILVRYLLGTDDDIMRYVPYTSTPVRQTEYYNTTAVLLNNFCVSQPSFLLNLSDTSTAVGGLYIYSRIFFVRVWRQPTHT